MDSNISTVVETAHTGAITDIAVDALGRKLASGSEDCSIQLWDIGSTGALEPYTTLTGHEAPVVQLAWAPQRFGPILVSCSTDKSVIVWSEVQEKRWAKTYTKLLPSIPTSIAWAPHEYGPSFACATSGGKVYVFTATSPHSRQLEQWDVSDFDAHANICTCLSWAPCLPPGSLCTMPLSQQQGQAVSSGLPPQRLVTAGNDRSIKVWRYAAQDRHWVREELAREEFTASWFEVSWASNIGIPFTYIAAGSAEGFVAVWRQDGLDGKWSSTVLPQFSDSITRLSWSLVGTLLLVSCADQTASLWREMPSGDWELQSTLCGGR